MRRPTEGTKQYYCRSCKKSWREESRDCFSDSLSTCPECGQEEHHNGAWASPAEIDRIVKEQREDQDRLKSRMKSIFFEIHHAPFEDGTPRHPLVSIHLKGRSLEIAESMMEDNRLSCEVDGIRQNWLIFPCDTDIRGSFAELLSELGVVGSIWVEYVFVTSR